MFAYRFKTNFDKYLKNLIFLRIYYNAFHAQKENGTDFY